MVRLTTGGREEVHAFSFWIWPPRRHRQWLDNSMTGCIKTQSQNATGVMWSGLMLALARHTLGSWRCTTDRHGDPSKV